MSAEATGAVAVVVDDAAHMRAANDDDDDASAFAGAVDRWGRFASEPGVEISLEKEKDRCKTVCWPWRLEVSFLPVKERPLFHPVLA